jgi:hypothetical protein
MLKTMKNERLKTKIIRISGQPPPLQTMIDGKQLENLEYFNYLDSPVISDAKYTREVKSMTAMSKEAFKQKKKTSSPRNWTYV